MLGFHWLNRRSTIVARDETSQPVELLLTVSRESSRTLGAQIEDHLRSSIRSAALRPGAQVPSTRDLARQLGVSRRVVVDAYAQLAAEGYLSLRQGARPRIADAVAAERPADASAVTPEPRVRFDFRPSTPDVSTFPRAAWLRSLREALATASDADFGYGDPRGVEALRSALADYLGRVRGVVARPEQILVTDRIHPEPGARLPGARGRGRQADCSRGSEQSRGRTHRRAGRPRARADRGRQRRDSDRRTRALRRRCDRADSRSPASDRCGAHGGATDSPIGLAAPARRDRHRGRLRRGIPLRPRRRGGTSGARPRPRASTPALRARRSRPPSGSAGWWCRPRCWKPSAAKSSSPIGGPRGSSSTRSPTSSRAASWIVICAGCEAATAPGGMRWSRRSPNVSRRLPVHGVAAGLHVTVQLPDGDSEESIREEARRRRLELETMSEFRTHAPGGPPILLLGYAQMPEPTIRAGVRELAEAVRAARRL